MTCHSERSDFGTPVESIGLHKPENLLLLSVSGPRSAEIAALDDAQQENRLSSFLTRSKSSSPNPIAVRRALLAWFRRRARPLPWRQTKDPYAVWVSEIMLQQTQVDTVVPYFVRFLQALPGFRRLAQAPLEHVLELWSGLGYYRRARNLHLAGQKVVHNFGGEFPSDYQKARSLPGVGDYTARAVLSIAYNQPYAVVDGNVARVVSRLRALRGNLHQRKFRRALTEALELIFSRRRPGNFNQAIMELGQSICLPRAPKCPLCPLRTICQAHRDGAPEAYPERRPRRPSETRYLATVVLYCTPQLLMDSVQSDARKLFDHSPRPLGGEGVSRDPVGTGPRSGAGEGVRFWPQAVQPQATKRLCVALGRGLDEGLMDGLWNFPAAFGSSPGEAVSRLQAKLRDMADSHIRWRDRSGSLRPVAQLHHGITYRSMTVDIYAAEVRGSITMNSLRWFTLSRLPRSAVSSLARKIAEKFCLAGTPSRTCG